MIDDEIKKNLELLKEEYHQENIKCDEREAALKEREELYTEVLKAHNVIKRKASIRHREEKLNKKISLLLSSDSKKNIERISLEHETIEWLSLFQANFIFTFHLSRSSFMGSDVYRELISHNNDGKMIEDLLSAYGGLENPSVLITSLYVFVVFPKERGLDIDMKNDVEILRVLRDPEIFTVTNNEKGVTPYEYTNEIRHAIAHANVWLDKGVLQGRNVDSNTHLKFEFQIRTENFGRILQAYVDYARRKIVSHKQECPICIARQHSCGALSDETPAT